MLDKDGRLMMQLCQQIDGFVDLEAGKSHLAVSPESLGEVDSRILVCPVAKAAVRALGHQNLVVSVVRHNLGLEERHILVGLEVGRRSLVEVEHRIQIVQEERPANVLV